MAVIDTEHYLTIDECASRTRVSKRWWYRLCQTRQIPHLRLGGAIRIAEVDFVALMRSHFRPQMTKRIDSRLLTQAAMHGLPPAFYEDEHDDPVHPEKANLT